MSPAALGHEHGHFHAGGPEMGRHFRRNESSHLQQFEVDELLILADALQLRHRRVDRRYGYHHGAAHTQHILKQVRATVDCMVLRVAAHTLAVEADFHFRKRWVGVDIFLNANAVTPFPLANTVHVRLTRKR